MSGKNLMSIALISARTMFPAEDRKALSETAKDLRLLDPTLERVMWACHTEDVEYLTALLQNGAPTQGTQRDALVDYWIHAPTVAALLDNDNTMTQERMQACMRMNLGAWDYHDVVRLLWERGVRPTVEDVARAVMYSVGDEQTILALLHELKWDFNTVDEEGQTVVAVLLDRANFAETCRSWRHCYCYQDELEPWERRNLANTVIPWLLAHGATANEKEMAKLHARVEAERTRDE